MRFRSGVQIENKITVTSPSAKHFFVLKVHGASEAKQIQGGKVLQNPPVQV